RGDGRAFAATGDAGQDDQALVIMAEFLDAGRQVQALEGGYLVGYSAGDQTESAALLEEVDTEAALVIADDVGIVSPAEFLQVFSLVRFQGREEETFHVFLS